MTIESIIQIICATASVIIAVVSIIISIVQFKKLSHVQKLIDKRDIDRYNENVNIDARKFITKYNETDEIQLLALCLVALYGTIYSFENSNLRFDHYGIIDDYASREDWKFEDLFLYSLLVINMYQEKNFAKE